MMFNCTSLKSINFPDLSKLTTFSGIGLADYYNTIDDLLRALNFRLLSEKLNKDLAYHSVLEALYEHDQWKILKHIMNEVDNKKA